jgi:hypothetical protein
MKLVTQAEAAVILRRSLATIYRWRRTGLLPSISGRPVMIDLTDIEKLKDIQKWQDIQQDHGSGDHRLATMKFAGLKKDGAAAFQRGQQTWLKRSNSSRVGSMRKHAIPKDRPPSK